MKSLAQLGEFGLIKRFSESFVKNLPKGVTGIGDDCAVIRLDNKQSLLVTTDLLIEGRHFLFNKITAYELGWKSLAVNLSDIAAMGGTPESAFLSISIPSKISIKWMDDFFKGIKNICSKYKVNLLGGDTTKSPDRLVINFTVLGKCANNNVKLRSSAKPGQLICVTDFLGDSGAGLNILLKNKKTGQLEKQMIKRHHMPKPQMAEGAFLASFPSVAAMMDVSDGVDSDIRRIMEASDTGAEIWIEKLPLSKELNDVCRKYSWNSESLALTGGEDYCLLLTIGEKDYGMIANKFRKRFKKPLFIIGKTTKTSKGLVYLKNGKKVIIEGKGFDHFK
jgi:thiamine-monophosphate kinase